MKRKAVMQLPAAQTKKMGKVLTIQTLDEILILNYWKDRALVGRYCMNTKTHEYATYYADGSWREQKLMSLMGYNPAYYSYYSVGHDVAFDPAAAKENIMAFLPPEYGENDPYVIIGHYEEDYSRAKREQKEIRRVERIREKMNQIPKLPDNFESWIHRVAAGGEEFGFYDKETDTWNCTACGAKYKEAAIEHEPGQKKTKNNQFFVCPECGKKIKAKKRSKGVSLRTCAVVLQNVNQRAGVARYIDVCIDWGYTGRTIKTSEAVRILLLRDSPRYACELYYGQGCRSDWGAYGEHFDDKNPSNRRIGEGYLHPEGIQEALRGTCFSDWDKLFHQLAQAGKQLDYNRLMIAQGNRGLINTVEYLFKGRFDRLLLETSRKISPYTCAYCGPLKIRGKSIEQVFDIQDRQLINRIRNCDGGENILKWMRWSEQNGKKIDEETLNWLTKSDIKQEDLSFLTAPMSLRQIMNYVEKQRADGYKGKSARTILNQWSDYLSMCRGQKKDLSDELVYRPRQLKRRHDEIVEEIRKQRAIEEMKRSKKAAAEAAKKMREKYPGAEEILGEIKEKYEYSNDEYMMIVPQRLTEIITEGNALHHCAGSSERYFERIMQRETYICFLRKVAEPKIPYYTIEVEPGGTIRQHRSYYDEEPGVREIRGFLREWQREIKKRLKAEDHKLAKISAQKRRKNIEELQAKNNIRVLKGLEEDFMEAI